MTMKNGGNDDGNDGKETRQTDTRDEVKLMMWKKIRITAVEEKVIFFSPFFFASNFFLC